MAAEDAQGSSQRETLIDDMLRQSARWLLADPDPMHFIARLAAEGPTRFGALFDDDEGQASMVERARVLRAFGWSIASAVPLPGNDFRPRALPLPGRNEPCICGSLRKFKQCCARLFDNLPRFDHEGLGPRVLVELARAEWAGLPATRVPVDYVISAAMLLREEQGPPAACQLLEPWAKAAAPWPAARAPLLDLLCDLYLDLGKPRKRKSLAQAMVEHGDAVVQSAGWRRLCMMASDAGDIAVAKAAFESAQRLTPDDPDIALLEVTTLLGAGERARAAERAAFHARRLTRLPETPERAHAVAVLESLARGEMPEFAPHESQAEDARDFEWMVDPDSPFARLERWVAALPPPKLRQRLDEATAEDLGRLAPAASSVAALVRWRKAFGLEAPTGAWHGVGPEALAVFENERWLALLEREPRLGDSFDVLDGLLLALELAPPKLVGLRADLLGRGLALWSKLRERFPHARCEWAHLDNRPALRVLVLGIEIDTTPRAESSLRWLQAMVEVLNPQDNHGLRERLAAVYLRRGEAAQALALCERYPDDFVGVQLLHTRALLALQRLDDAAAALASALRANPHVAPLLVAPKAPRRPNVHAFAVGSVEQAKVSVHGQHDLWRDKAVQHWLRDQLTSGTTRTLFDLPG